MSVASRALTEASDWYAFGAMLYEALTGELPGRHRSTACSPAMGIAATVHDQATGVSEGRQRGWGDGLKEPGVHTGRPGVIVRACEHGNACSILSDRAAAGEFVGDDGRKA